MTKVFIDGSAGTTGLRIFDRLSVRKDIELMTLPDSLRKDIEARREALNTADVVFLCLPDDAAREAVSLIDNDRTIVIDASTAHRTASDWTYGFPELCGLREKVAASKRIANPGCHAGGFIALIRPLVENGIIAPDTGLSCFSLTGYSGAGKSVIAVYEDEKRDTLLESPRQYALSQTHKHLPEMLKVSGLSTAPIFSPIIASFYSGMEVTVPLFADSINGGLGDIEKLYSDYYGSGSAKDGEGVVRFVPGADENGFLAANALSGRDDMQISVFGNEERILLVSRFDNLGKGASGAAIQNMNTVIGADEKTGLIL